jgi:hypothetical protein
MSENYNEIEPRMELKMVEMMKEERECSDKRYAIKLVEGIVFALVGLLCIGVIGALIKLVIK